MNLTAHLHLVPRLSIDGAIPPLTHMPSWHGAHLCTGATLPYVCMYSNFPPTIENDALQYSISFHNVITNTVTHSNVKNATAIVLYQLCIQ
jgi:hypothetical protein